MKQVLATTTNLSIARSKAGRTVVLVFVAALNFGHAVTLPVNAQGYGSPGTQTLRDPLIPGASWTNFGMPAPIGAPPPIGSGAVPMPINPGQLTGPTFEPWVQRIPSNQIDQPNSQVNVPFTPATALPPGVAGPMVNTPAPPSTPGADPGMLRNPSEAGFGTSSAAQVTVPAGGRYPDDAAPTTHRPGATTRDFGLRRASVRGRPSSTLFDSSVRLSQKPVVVPPRYSEDGRIPVIPATQNPAAGDPPGGIKVTNDLYGTPMLSNTNGGLTPLTTIAPY